MKRFVINRMQVNLARAAVPGLMFCVGACGMLVQIFVLREFLVVFFGNELTIGMMFGVWLILVGLGSLLARIMMAGCATGRLCFALIMILAGLVFWPPLQVAAIRVIRAFLQVPYGEYASFAAMLTAFGIVLLPVCPAIGFIFPIACRLAEERGLPALSRVYAMDALGGLAAGALFSYGLVFFMSHLALALLASALALLGMACLLAGGMRRRVILGLAFGLICWAVVPGGLAPLESALAKARWQAFGALPAARSWSGRLAASLDSRYQNLTLIETEGQFAVYANGQISFIFPDVIAGEHKIHFIMAQNPDARRVLLVGGNPVNDLPELLKYPLDELVWVELDGKIGVLLDAVVLPEYRRALADPRLIQAHEDAPHYLKRYARAAAGKKLFDAVIIDVAGPTTMALNRFYTREFYADIRRALAPGGFMYAAVEASEDLQGANAFLGGSIFNALNSVFEHVLIGVGTRLQFFAGADAGSVTFAREELFRRSVKAGITTDYFQPEYFLFADEISPEKTALARQRLAAVSGVNSIFKPVSTYYQLALWNILSGSGLREIFKRPASFLFVRMLLLAVGLGGLVLLAGGCLRGLGARVPSDLPARLIVPALAGLAGLCGMALELALVFVFQALLGYVYLRMGLIVGVFMLGLTFGALGAPRRLGGGIGRWFGLVAVMELILLAETVLLPVLVAALAVDLPSGLIEMLLYLLAGLTGAAVGAHFVLVNRLLRESVLAHGGESARSGFNAAALTNAADLWGAALGAMTVGAVLLPLLGLQQTCLLLSSVMLLGLCLLLFLWRGMR